MNPIRAVILDVYRTLLVVEPGPADAEARWRALWHRVLGGVPPGDLTEVARQAEAVIRIHHTRARAQGIPHPEIDWPAVMQEVLPPLGDLNPVLLGDFLTGHTRLTRSVRVAAETATLLTDLHQRGMVLGIASNAQAYTLAELRDALRPHGLDMAEIFHPELRFWSFENGFSKPDPHVFRILSARLGRLGISPAQTLMVGDRQDNDIEPARNAGWVAWRLDPALAPGTAWAELRTRFFHTPPLPPPHPPAPPTLP